MTTGPPDHLRRLTLAARLNERRTGRMQAKLDRFAHLQDIHHDGFATWGVVKRNWTLTATRVRFSWQWPSLEWKTAERNRRRVKPVGMGRSSWGAKIPHERIIEGLTNIFIDLRYVHYYLYFKCPQPTKRTYYGPQKNSGSKVVLSCSIFKP